MKVIVNLIACLSVSPVCLAAEEVTVEKLHAALQRSERHLNDTHIVFATRNFATWNFGATQVFHYDLWVRDQAVQARQLWVTSAGEKWWEGHAGCSKPFTAENVNKLTGYVICARAGEDLCRSEFMVMPPGRTGQYPSMLTLSRKKLPVGHPLPLIEVGRAWNMSPQGGSPPLVNQLSQTRWETWRILGHEQTGGEDAVKVEIPRHQAVQVPLKRHEGKLGITPTLICWFSIKEDHVPLRIEDSCRYSYKDQEYTVVRTGEAKPFYVYEATETGTPLKGMRYPISGKQETYHPVNQAGKPFDPDDLVDELLSTGKVTVREPLSMSTRDEWRVLKMERISPETELWLEPPKDCCVRDLENNELHISGVNHFVSQWRLGLDPVSTFMNRLIEKLSGKTINRPKHRSNPDKLSAWISLLAGLVLIFLLILSVRSLLRRKRSRGIGSASAAIPNASVPPLT